MWAARTTPSRVGGRLTPGCCAAACLELLESAASSPASWRIDLAAAGNPDEWDRMFRINVAAPMRLMRLLAPGMKDKVR